MTVEPMTRVQMNRHDRKWIQLRLVTAPAVTTWEMSFDDGITWHNGTAVAGQADNYRWLVAGNRVTQAAAVAMLVPGQYDVMVRAISDPELVVKRFVIEVD